LEDHEIWWKSHRSSWVWRLAMFIDFPLPFLIGGLISSARY
jgi:hypothetical protein